jgi:hypothetical protein
VADITVYAQWTVLETPINAQAPAIGAQPQDATYTLGDEAAALSVTASSPDGGVLSYQWYNASGSGGWAAISGATESSYTPPTAAAGAVPYYVRVTNTNNNVNGTKTAAINSGAAIVTVSSVPVTNARAPVISVQPRSAAYNPGDEAAALSVTASSPDGGTLSYQWFNSSGDSDEWTAIEDATQSNYTPPIVAAGTVAYYVRVTNTNDGVTGTKTLSANSGTATVTVSLVHARAPVISVQPRSAVYNVGDTAAALSVTASSPDGGVLSYQWFNSSGDSDEWEEISGATQSSYAPPTAAAGTVPYYVRVTNTNDGANGVKTLSANSGTATVTVSLVHAQAPVIKTQPQSATYTTATAANVVPLSVTAESPDGGTLSYQWHSRGGSESPWAAINGATGASYTPPVAALGTLYYYAAITNTNNNASGRKTASINSEAVSVMRTLVNAEMPRISVQPQDGTYYLGDTPAALFVTAASPDGGTLSYQWHSRDGSDSPWTEIPGETGASYTPPATLGTVYYYVAITNTNTGAGIDGLVTGIRNSSVATVRVKNTGTGDFSFDVWANDDGGLVSAMPGYFDISRSLGQTLTLTAVGGLSDIQWSINGVFRSADQSFAMAAAVYPPGNYTLGLRAKQGAIPYSINFTVTVDN